jgi:hypothetical protein
VICLLIKKICCKKLTDMPRSYGTPRRDRQNEGTTPTGKGKGKRKALTNRNGRGAVRGSNKRNAQAEIDRARDQKAAEDMFRITLSNWEEEKTSDAVRDAIEAMATARTVALAASDATKAAAASAQKAIRAVPTKKSTGKAPARRGTGTAVAVTDPVAAEALAAATTALQLMAESDPRPAAGGADPGGAFWAGHFRKSKASLLAARKKNKKRREDDPGGLFWANRPASKKKKRKVGDLGSSLNRAERETLKERVKAHNPPSNRSVENSTRYIPLKKSVDALPSKCTNANKYWIPPKMISYRRRAYCMTPPKLKRRR